MLARFKIFSGSWKLCGSFAESSNNAALKFAPAGGEIVPNNPPK